MAIDANCASFVNLSCKFVDINSLDNAETNLDEREFSILHFDQPIVTIVKHWINEEIMKVISNFIFSQYK